MAETDVTAT